MGGKGTRESGLQDEQFLTGVGFFVGLSVGAGGLGRRVVGGAGPSQLPKVCAASAPKAHSSLLEHAATSCSSSRITL